MTQTSPSGPASAVSLRRPSRRARRERAVELALFACGLLSVLTTLGIVAVLVGQSVGFFRQISLVQFLTDTKWTPLFTEKHFGILPLLNGTLMVAVGSSVIAIPVGLASAIYLSEYASSATRKVVKPALEILAGIPTVVYGYFALTFVTPVLQSLFPDVSFYNAASASIVVGIMIIPMVSSLSEDALSAVPRSLREAAYGVGATKFEVATRVVVPAGLSGVIASFILAVSRAIGETMAVTLAAGMTPKMTLSFFESIQTMTAYIVQVSIGDTPHGTLEYQTIFAVGLVLFLITLGMNLLSQAVSRRFREVYE